MDNNEDEDRIEPWLHTTEDTSVRLLDLMADVDKDNVSVNPLVCLGPNTALTLQRKLYTQEQVDSEYVERLENPTLRERIKNLCACSSARFLSIFLSYFPIVDVIRNYVWRKDTIHDLVAGLSVSFIHMPQGLALGLLASVPAVFGLYSSFYPVLIYLVFGTCRHVSMGTNALFSLLTASVVERELDLHMRKVTGFSTAAPLSTTPTSFVTTSDEMTSTAGPDVEPLTAMLSVDEQNAYKVGVASALALITGLLLLGMGLFKLGFINNYLSTPFVGGFTTAAAVHIVTSQIPKMLRIKVPPQTGAGRVVKTYIHIFEKIHETNPADVIVSALSLVFLLGVTIFVNERYRKKLRVPIPADLIIVVVSTMISHFAHLERNYGLAVVGDIPLGLPAPVLPNTEVFSRIIVDAFTIAILIFTLTIALAKLTSGIHNYSIDPDQELVAYGLCNTLSSFFQCFPTGTAPPRTMLLSNIGAKSTLNGIITAIFILLIVLAAGRLFVALPVAVLAAMICVAIKNLLLQVGIVPSLWRVSKPDFVIWVGTCLSSVFIDLDVGIIVGVGISVFTVIVRSQLVSGTVGGLSTKEDLVLYGTNRQGIKESKMFRIFHFPSQLFFANVDRFTSELFSKTLNPTHLDLMMSGKGREKTTSNISTITKDDINTAASSSSNTTISGDPELNVNDSGEESVRYVILECSAMSYIDLAGANALKKVAGLYQKVGVTLLLTRCPNYTLNLLDRAGYFKAMDRDTAFCDVYDAITCILKGSV